MYSGFLCDPHSNNDSFLRDATAAAAATTTTTMKEPFMHPAEVPVDTHVSN